LEREEEPRYQRGRELKAAAPNVNSITAVTQRILWPMPIVSTVWIICSSPESFACPEIKEQGRSENLNNPESSIPGCFQAHSFADMGISLASGLFEDGIGKRCAITPKIWKAPIAKRNLEIRIIPALASEDLPNELRRRFGRCRNDGVFWNSAYPTRADADQSL
jgi:hypothetical protein